jgi:pyridinium-3,5-bisthiocarboxylic acid mononucleotide nickel chelatase
VLWPGVIAALIDAGAGDAWLVPIAMKKGRPAHMLCAIVSADRSAAVRSVMFRQTTTIGIRETRVAKHALHREFRTVEVAAQPISVKLGLLPDGEIVNASAGWDDVARVAEELGQPAKHVLAQAVGQAAGFTDHGVEGGQLA